MLQYVNRYYGAVNNDRAEVILSFYQEDPSPEDLRSLKPGVNQVSAQNISTNEIAKFVMSKECAEKLLGLLQQLLQTHSDSTDEPKNNK